VYLILDSYFCDVAKLYGPITIARSESCDAE